MSEIKTIPTIYAILQNPNCGYEVDKKMIAKEGFFVGQKFVLRNASVSRWHTTVYLNGYSQGFNSVHFDFIDAEGNPVDILNIPRFNMYARF